MNEPEEVTSDSKERNRDIIEEILGYNRDDAYELLSRPAGSSEFAQIIANNTASDAFVKLRKLGYYRNRSMSNRDVSAKKEGSVGNEHSIDKESKRPGRRSLLESYKEESICLLESIIEFTSDEKNKRLPFQSSEEKHSLCKYVSERLSEHAVISQKSIEFRVTSTVRQLAAAYNLEIPAPKYNVRYYFEHRDKLILALSLFKQVG